MVFRVGGDEFVILVRGADYENRDALKEKLNDSADYGGVAVACGMAVYDPETDKDMRGVFKRADAMMYENKRKMKEAAKKQD